MTPNYYLKLYNFFGFLSLSVRHNIKHRYLNYLMLNKYSCRFFDKTKCASFSYLIGKSLHILVGSFSVIECRF